MNIEHTLILVLGLSLAVVCLGVVVCAGLATRHAFSKMNDIYGDGPQRAAMQLQREQIQAETEKAVAEARQAEAHARGRRAGAAHTEEVIHAAAQRS